MQMRVKMTFNATFPERGSFREWVSPCLSLFPLSNKDTRLQYMQIPGAGSTLALSDKSQAWIKVTAQPEAALLDLGVLYSFCLTTKQPYAPLPSGEEISLEIPSFLLSWLSSICFSLAVASGSAGWPAPHDMNRISVASPSTDGCKDSC